MTNRRIPIGSSMEWTRSDEDLLVRLDPGEEIHSTLQQLADDVGFNRCSHHKWNRKDATIFMAT